MCDAVWGSWTICCYIRQGSNCWDHRNGLRCTTIWPPLIGCRAPVTTSCYSCHSSATCYQSTSPAAVVCPSAPFWALHAAAPSPPTPMSAPPATPSLPPDLIPAPPAAAPPRSGPVIALPAAALSPQSSCPTTTYTQPSAGNPTFCQYITACWQPDHTNPDHSHFNPTSPSLTRWNPTSRSPTHCMASYGATS